MTDTKHDKGRARKIRVNALLEKRTRSSSSARPSGSMSSARASSAGHGRSRELAFAPCPRQDDGYPRRTFLVVGRYLCPAPFRIARATVSFAPVVRGEREEPVAASRRSTAGSRARAEVAATTFAAFVKPTSPVLG